MPTAVRRGPLERRRAFFFEKKNQKTLLLWLVHGAAAVIAGHLCGKNFIRAY
jgi:hypothetical protein